MTQKANATRHAAAARPGPTPPHPAAGLGEAGQQHDDLAPMLAGARARGMFDALDLIGQAAILLDRDGRALAITGATRRFLGLSLELVEGRLVGLDHADDERLQGAIREAIAGRAAQIEIGDEGDAAFARCLPIPADPHQLLAAIALISAAPCALRPLAKRRVAASTLYAARN